MTAARGRLPDDLKGAALETAIALEDVAEVAAWLEGRELIAVDLWLGYSDTHLSVTAASGECRRWRFAPADAGIFAEAAALARAALAKTIAAGVR